MLELRYALLVVGQQLLEAIDIALVHETAASRACMALALGVLVAEVMASTGRVPLEAVCRLAETLRRGPVGFQLGHVLNSSLSPEFARCRNTRLLADRALAANSSRALRDHFFFGANSITICRPSISGFCSTTL